MNNGGLLAQLSRAQTEEERSWIITESFLQALPAELTAAVWAAAIPHWFNTDILVALRPELQPHAESLYDQLRTLPFVEVFSERGHNLHERTRQLMLQHLWQQNREEFCQLSANAAAYFAQAGSSSALQIEWLYHLAVADKEWKNTDLWTVAQNWTNNFRHAELESLISTLLEQVEGQRTCLPATAEIYYWTGNAKYWSHQQTEALSYYQTALKLFRSLGDSRREAYALNAIRLHQVWVIRWIVMPMIHFLPRDRREEWLGDLYEVDLELLNQGYPLWQINLINIANTIVLVASALRIKVSNFVFSAPQKQK